MEYAYAEPHATQPRTYWRQSRPRPDRACALDSHYLKPLSPALSSLRLHRRDDRTVSELTTCESPLEIDLDTFLLVNHTGTGGVGGYLRPFCETSPLMSSKEHPRCTKSRKRAGFSNQVGSYTLDNTQNGAHR